LLLWSEELETDDALVSELPDEEEEEAVEVVEDVELEDIEAVSDPDLTASASEVFVPDPSDLSASGLVELL
jgi:hypothetical protein